MVAATPPTNAVKETRELGSACSSRYGRADASDRIWATALAPKRASQRPEGRLARPLERSFCRSAQEKLRLGFKEMYSSRLRAVE